MQSMLITLSIVACGRSFKRNDFEFNVLNQKRDHIMHTHLYTTYTVQVLCDVIIREIRIENEHTNPMRQIHYRLRFIEGQQVLPLKFSRFYITAETKQVSFLLNFIFNVNILMQTIKKQYIWLIT